MSRHLPERTCVGCSRKHPKNEMVRFVATPNGIRVGASDGRGFYVCRSALCLDMATRKRGLRKLLGRDVRSKEIETLREAILGAADCHRQAGGEVSSLRSTGGAAIG